MRRNYHTIRTRFTYEKYPYLITTLAARPQELPLRSFYGVELRKLRA
jgi:hypothetical protein